VEKFLPSFKAIKTNASPQQMVLQSAEDYPFKESAINPVPKHRNSVLKGEKNSKPF
jgi:hypothetical protein